MVEFPVLRLGLKGYGCFRILQCKILYVCVCVLFFVFLNVSFWYKFQAVYDAGFGVQVSESCPCASMRDIHAHAHGALECAGLSNWYPNPRQWHEEPCAPKPQTASTQLKDAAQEQQGIHSSMPLAWLLVEFYFV